MSTEAGPVAGQGLGMKPGGDQIAGGGGGGNERHSGEDADGPAGTLFAEPVGWRARGRQDVFLLAAGRPCPRNHRANLQARTCSPGREVRGPGGRPLRWEARVRRRASGAGPPAGLTDCVCVSPSLRLSGSVTFLNPGLGGPVSTVGRDSVIIIWGWSL